MRLLLRRTAAVLIVAALLGGVTALAGWDAGLFSRTARPSLSASYIATSDWEGGTAYGNTSAVRPDGRWPSVFPPAPEGVPVLRNDCSAGYVTFTFDDGPNNHTMALASELLAEHVPAVFFEIGDRVAQNPGITRALAAHGFVIGDHTYNHEDMTGVASRTRPLTSSQVRAELLRTISAIVAAGAPRPVMWRPPYGDVSTHDNAIAGSLGLRLVMSWSSNGTIIDNGDWAGASPAKIVRNVTQAAGLPLRNGVIVAGHDGIANTVSTISAMPGIVGWMNAHHLCATSSVRADATGAVPAAGGAHGTESVTATPLAGGS